MQILYPGALGYTDRRNGEDSFSKRFVPSRSDALLVRLKPAYGPSVPGSSVEPTTAPGRQIFEPVFYRSLHHQPRFADVGLS